MIKMRTILFWSQRIVIKGNSKLGVIESNGKSSPARNENYFYQKWDPDRSIPWPKNPLILIIDENSPNQRKI